MALNTQRSIGILLLLILCSGIVYIEWSNNARVRIDNDKSTFYVPSDTSSKIWVIAGREYNKLYDGNKLLKRDVKAIKINTTVSGNLVKITRSTPYQGNNAPLILDTYLFDGGAKDIELFPIYHSVEVFNATGKYYRYDVKNLQYDGTTFKLDGTQTEMDFGRNMKVTWWKDYSSGYVYKTGSMYVRSNKITSDYARFDVRLFDPDPDAYNVTLYLDGLNESRRYEYYTVANITANVTGVCDGVATGDCTLCVDIDDALNNITLDIGSKNYACGNQSVSFLYNITTLRENMFYYNGICYQETANVSTSCGGLSYGTYSCDDPGGDGDCSNIRDENWSSYKGAPLSWTLDFYINYSKPWGALNSSLWEVKTGGYTQNFSINSGCWSENVLQFRLTSRTGICGSNCSLSWCRSGSDWIQLDSGSSNSHLYEEAMNWEFNRSAKLNISSGNSASVTIDNQTDIARFRVNVTEFSILPANEFCYQESANVSNSCGGLSNGSFNISSSSTKTGNVEVFSFYEKPKGEEASGAILQLKTNTSGPYNYTLHSSCFSYSNLTILNNVTDRFSDVVVNTSCKSDSGWVSVFNEVGAFGSVCGTTAAANPKFAIDGQYSSNMFRFESTGNYLNCSGATARGILFEEAVHWEFDVAGGADNVSIDVNEDGVNDVLLLGRLWGDKLRTDVFTFNNVKQSKGNISRNSPGTKVIYLNVTTAGFDNSRLPVLNFSFRIDGFSIDQENELHYLQNFTDVEKGVNGTYGIKMGIMSPIVDFYKNDSSDFTKTSSGGTMEIISPFTSGAYIRARTVASGSGIGYELVTMNENLPNFDLRYTNQFRTNMTSAYGASTGPNGCLDWYRQVHLTDGTTFIPLFLVGQTLDESQSISETKALDISGVKTSANEWDIYYGDVYNRHISTSPLNPAIKPFLRFLLTRNSACTGSVSIDNTINIYNISTSGISLMMNNSNYTTAPNNYTSPSLNISKTDILRTMLTVETYLPTNTSLRYFLSNDNQTTWEEVINGSIHVFSSLGKNISARFQLTSDNISVSPIIRRYNVDIVPSAVTNLSVDVGSSDVLEWNYTGVLNDTNSPQHFRENGSAVKSYITSHCIGNLTCYVPITLTFGSGGTIQISEFNFSINPNPLNFSATLVETFNVINVSVSFVRDSFIQLSELVLDFLGSKSITFFAHFQNNSALNDSQIMNVKYSKFNVSLPVNVSFWEVFPKGRNDTNVTPYGQVNTTPIWNITSLAYDVPFDVYIRTNVTLNSCLNITFGNTSSKLGSVYLNTTPQLINPSVDILQNNGRGAIWNYVDLLNCSNRFELPWFYFSAKCANCVNTSNFQDTNFIME